MVKQVHFVLLTSEKDMFCFLNKTQKYLQEGVIMYVLSMQKSSCMYSGPDLSL